MSSPTLQQIEDAIRTAANQEEAARLLGFPSRHALYRRRLKLQNETPAEDDSSSFSFNVEGNHASASVVSEHIGAEDALRAAGIDLDVWKIVSFTVGWHEVGRKDVVKKLTFDEGRITGQILDTGKIHKEKLYRYVAKLERREKDPDINWVTPKPVRLDWQPQEPSEPEHMVLSDTKKALIITDTHFGFRNIDGQLEPTHDPKALAAVESLAHCGWEFDRIIHAGDLLDLPDWSLKFVQSPEFSNQTQRALEAAATHLAGLRALWPNAQFDLLEGNHDKRMRDAIQAQLAAAAGIKPVGSKHEAYSIPHLLGLEDLRINFVGPYPDGQVWINDRLVVIHGHVVGGQSGQTVQKVLAAPETTSSVIFGHIHRIEQAYHTVHGMGGVDCRMAMSPGCLCRTDGIVPAAKEKNNWQQGVGIVEYEDFGDHQFRATTHPIFDGRISL